MLTADARLGSSAGLSFDETRKGWTGSCQDLLSLSTDETAAAGEWEAMAELVRLEVELVFVGTLPTEVTLEFPDELLVEDRLLEPPPVVEAVVLEVLLLADCDAPFIRYATTNRATSSPQSDTT